jgi:hypothetical protein
MDGRRDQLGEVADQDPRHRTPERSAELMS